MENIKDLGEKSKEVINIEKSIGNQDFDGIDFLVNFLDELIQCRNSFLNPRLIDLDINKIVVDSFGKPLFSMGEDINVDFDCKLFELIETILLKEKIRVKTIEKRLKKYIENQQYHKLKTMVSSLRYDKLPLDINQKENSSNQTVNSMKNASKEVPNSRAKIRSISLNSLGKLELATVVFSALIFLGIIGLRIRGKVFKYSLQTFLVLLALNSYLYFKGRIKGKKQAVEKVFILISKDYKTKYYLAQGNNFFGRSADYADHVVEEKTIGRRHANIIVSGDNIFVRDLNSMNGTFINEKPLNNLEMAVYENDNIKLANREFILLRN